MHLGAALRSVTIDDLVPERVVRPALPHGGVLIRQREFQSGGLVGARGRQCRLGDNAAYTGMAPLQARRRRPGAPAAWSCQTSAARGGSGFPSTGWDRAEPVPRIFV